MNVVVEVRDIVRRWHVRTLVGVPLRSDQMLTWLPAKVLADLGVVPSKTIDLQRESGRVFQRRCGGVLLTIHDRTTVDDVVFAEDDDAISIGWRVLAGLNLEFDSRVNDLVDRGPIPAAAS